MHDGLLALRIFGDGGHSRHRRCADRKRHFVDRLRRIETRDGLAVHLNIL